ncbi:hypothetical protein ACF0H5_004507 [Mactra antiquata]
MGGKGGPYCEFRVRVQQDRSTIFESVKNPLQFLTIGADGCPGDVRGVLDKDPSRRYYVYSKVSHTDINTIVLTLQLFIHTVYFQ